VAPQEGNALRSGRHHLDLLLLEVLLVLPGCGHEPAEQLIGTGVA
jgi:hypothetical protein